MYETTMAGRYASAPRMGGRTTPEPPVRSMTPSGTRHPATTVPGGLIRLSLKKPMGIVFEPTYDSNNKSQQRGVRICDLPRTGAAALSRQLQVGDELLQINHTVVSRLGFDEIMELIIEADPENVNLLFRRPKKEVSAAARQKVKENHNSTVKWVDEEEKGKKKKKKKKTPVSPKKKPVEDDEEETLQSKSTLGTDSYVKKRKTKKPRRKTPYDSESFLDMLIDAVCSENTCRDTMRRDDFSDDDSETYATYEEARTKTETPKKYEDDGTLESVDTRDRPPVLGLAPNPQPAILMEEDTDSGNNPAPIKELEYNDDVADVSVMESVGGPSLLLEKQRAAQLAKLQPPAMVVPDTIIRDFGQDFALPGMSRMESIQADPTAFYSHIVRQLLQQHEPEKVRLLDKLLSKYKGREDNLVQKLSVRYQPPPEETEAPPEEPEEEEEEEEEPPITPPPKEDTPTDEPSEYSGTDNEDSVDGTSPAVIAQVSELLNYVYGKTTVPGQIDRVSTIMRAYEGREAVLLELLETKALIKANKEKENADNLPSFLRNSQLPIQDEMDEVSEEKEPTTPNTSLKNSGGTVIHDDISSMSGVSSPAVDLKQDLESSPKNTPRKKKGLFGGLFKKKPITGRSKIAKKADGSI